MDDLQKQIYLTLLLNNYILDGATDAVTQPGVRFVKNVHKTKITLEGNLRMMIGEPVAEGEETVEELKARGVWGVYEMPNTETTRELYGRVDDMARREDLTPEKTIRRKFEDDFDNIRLGIDVEVDFD